MRHDEVFPRASGLPDFVVPCEVLSVYQQHLATFARRHTKPDWDHWEWILPCWVIAHLPRSVSQNYRWYEWSVGHGHRQLNAYRVGWCNLLNSFRVSELKITVDDQVSGRDPNKRVFFFKRVWHDSEKVIRPKKKTCSSENPPKIGGIPLSVRVFFLACITTSGPPNLISVYPRQFQFGEYAFFSINFCEIYKIQKPLHLWNPKRKTFAPLQTQKSAKFWR